jgi:membrane fusion protein, multidrug efflux system
MRPLASWRTAAAGAAWLGLSLSCGGCSAGGPGPAGQGAQAAAVTVDVVHVVQQPVNVTLAMPGQLDPYESVAIYPRATGFVRTIRVDRGSRVRAGDVLAEIEAPELLAQRAEAQSKLQAAEAQLAVARSKADSDASTYERLRSASRTPGVVAGNDLAITQKAVEANEGLVAAAQQTVEAARQMVRSVTDLEGYLRVSAPFDGVVTERNIHPGALVGPASGAGASMPMMRLVHDERLRLVVPVPEAYVAGVTEGTRIPFTVTAYPGRAFTGVIARIAHAVDVRTRTMAVELDVANDDRRLVPGTYCQIQWRIQRTEPSLFVPNLSVAATTDRTFVVRILNGKSEWVDVKTGLAAGPLTEVFGDLRPGDLVAARGTDELRPGTEVQTRELKPPAR